ncbi:MAG: outer membrane beta-barrel protein, partial [Myxococcota bacterium]
RHHERARETASRHHQAAATSRHRAATARHHSSWSARHGHARWNRPAGWFRPYHAHRPVHWYHGVFVYGPYPWYHHDRVVYVNGNGGGGSRGGGGEASEARAPKRAVDRARTFAIGVRGGSYLGGYETGDAYGDAGLGIAARYRPVEAVGLELAWEYHDETWSQDTERINQPLQASVQLFAAPWSRVNPYVLAGVTINQRNVQDTVGPFFVDQDQALWGPHGGLGLEVNVGKKVSVNGDVRYVGYLNVPDEDLTRPGAFQANLGLNFYF